MITAFFETYGEFFLYILLGLFIVLEIALLATKEAELFVLTYRWIRRKLVNSDIHRLIAIPDRLKAQIANESIEVGAEIRVVDSLPLIPVSDIILLTAKETKAKAGTIFYLAAIEKNSLAISEQSMFSPDDSEPLSP